MTRLLIKFEKSGPLAWLSHLEMTRALERALRRSGLPLAYTRGFSPHPRISCTPALPVGVGSRGEYLEVALDREVETGGLAGRLNREMPEGLKALSAEALPEHFPKMSRWVRYALYRVEPGEGSGAAGVLLAMPLPAAGVDRDCPRLRDALQALAEREGWGGARPRVTRQGLYASLDEVREESEGRLLEVTGRDPRFREARE